MKTMKTKNRTSKLLAIFFIFLFTACQDFLELKPDKKLVNPTSYDDLMALMNNANVMNYGFVGGAGEAGSDNLFVRESIWNALIGLAEEDVSTYIWRKIPIPIYNWNTIYRSILQCNIVIENIDKVHYSDPSKRDELLGIAHFFRGFAFYDLSQIYSVPYNSGTAKEKMGIILRLSPDINDVSKRSTLQASYDQIIKDLMKAADLLPYQKPLYPTRPYKAAAYAALARVHLTMREYKNAGNYADSALALQSELLNYNNIIKKDFPFEKFNPEVIFYSNMSGPVSMTQANHRVDTNLIGKYHVDDLRRTLYFNDLPDGYQSFVGDYSEQTGTLFFNGLTTSELYLIRAECAVRDGELAQAKDDIYMLIRNRYRGDYNLSVGSLKSEGLKQEILLERRKELVFRGLRWSDIRRLNEETPIRLEKEIGQNKYFLESENIKNFAFLIPQLAIERMDIQQN